MSRIIGLEAIQSTYMRPLRYLCVRVFLCGWRLCDESVQGL